MKWYVRSMGHTTQKKLGKFENSWKNRLVVLDRQCHNVKKIPRMVRSEIFGVTFMSEGCKMV